MKVLVIVGTRPEAIKMAPVINALKERPTIEVEVLNTGQHKDLLDGVLEIFQLKADAFLELMQPGQSLTSLTSRTLDHVGGYLAVSKPSMVLVHGDTTTAMASSLAAFYAGIHVGHVEAGLRTRNLSAPFPEEMNRQTIARYSSLNFAPTSLAATNLRSENVSESSVVITGNSIVDSCVWVHAKYLSDNTWVESTWDHLTRKVGFHNDQREFALVTLHRRENSGESFLRILASIAVLSFEYPKIDFIFPVHPNPIISGIASDKLGNLPNVFLCKPLDYLEFTLLLSRCKLVISDSGGIQEEGVTFGKTVLVAREDTERPEGLKTGHLKLVGSEEKLLLEHGRAVLSGPMSTGGSLNLESNPYGDGRASVKIAETISTYTL